jgi:bacterioferritin-associated ferredoxin
MIVCSCNVITDAQLIATLDLPADAAPKTPGQAYRCLGCNPCCGRCLPLVNEIIRQARSGDDPFGCGECPGLADDAAPVAITDGPLARAAE